VAATQPSIALTIACFGRRDRLLDGGGIAAAAARLLPVTAADLIAQLCQETGAFARSVRVGTVTLQLL